MIVVGKFNSDHETRCHLLNCDFYVITDRIYGDGDGRRRVATLVHCAYGFGEDLLRAMITRGFGRCWR
jgi:hypothetical protein